MACPASPKTQTQPVQAPPARSGTICLHNQTSIPLVYVLAHLSPLYWGVIQPGERVQRRTGPFWFTLTTFPHTGDNEPGTCGVVMGHVRDVFGFLFALATVRNLLTPSPNGPVVNSWTALLGGAVAGRLTGEMIKRECLGSMEGGEWNMVRERGVWAGGRWIYIQGGPREDGGKGRPMYFSRLAEEEAGAGER